MKPDKLVCGSDNITYYRGYIALWLEDEGFSSTCDVGGVTFLKRTAFHVSLMYVPNILAKHPDLEEKILQSFCNFQNGHTFSIQEFTGELRHVTDTERGRESVIAMCTVNNLDKWSKVLERELKITVEPHPTHVTMYTLEENLGIGVNSHTELEKKSELIILPELLEVIESLK